MTFEDVSLLQSNPQNVINGFLPLNAFFPSMNCSTSRNNKPWKLLEAFKEATHSCKKKQNLKKYAPAYQLEFFQASSPRPVNLSLSHD